MFELTYGEDLIDRSLTEVPNPEFEKGYNSYWETYDKLFGDEIPKILHFFGKFVKLNKADHLQIIEFVRMLKKNYEDRGEDYYFRCKSHRESFLCIYCENDEKNFCKICSEDGLCTNQHNKIFFSQKKEDISIMCKKINEHLKKSDAIQLGVEELFEFAKEKIDNNLYNHLFFQIIEKLLEYLEKKGDI